MQVAVDVTLHLDYVEEDTEDVRERNVLLLGEVHAGVGGVLLEVLVVRLTKNEHHPGRANCRPASRLAVHDVSMRPLDHRRLFRGLSPQRRNGDFSACWDEREAAFGGVCRWPLVAFGSTRPKKIKKILARLGWFFCRWRQAWFS